MSNGLKTIYYASEAFSKKPFAEKLRLASVFLVLSIFFLAPLVSKNRALFSGGIFVSMSLLAAFFLIVSYFRKIDNTPPASMFLAAFTVLCFVSSFFSAEREQAFVQTSYFASWLVFYYCGCILREKKRIVLMVSLLSVSCVLLYALWQYTVIFPAIKENLSSGGGFHSIASTAAAGRLFSTFLYPNSFAAYLILISGPVLTVISAEKKLRLLKFLALSVQFLISFSIYLTSSRLGIALWAISFLACCLYLLAKDRKALAFAAFFALAGISTAYTVNKFKRDMPAMDVRERISTLSGDSNSKLFTFRGSLSMTWDNPWTGTGPGSFKRNYARYRPQRQTDLPSSAHNIILDISSTAGIPASILFASAIFVILWEVFSSPIVFIFLLSMFIHSLADWDFNNLGISLLFFFLSGAHSKPAEKKIPGRFFALFLASLCLFFSFFSARSGLAGRYYERASFHLTFGSPESASIYAQKASEINRARSDYYFLKGLSSIDPDTAASLFITASEKAPAWYEPYYHLARIAMAKGDFASAESFFQKAHDLFPTSAEIKIYIDSLETMD